MRRWRLATGLLLFFFLVTHLLNHALGLAGREALAAGRDAFLFLWRNPAGELLLFAALIGHLGLGFAALYRRRRFLQLRPWEAAQLLLGLLIPPLLFIHILGTVIAAERYGLVDSYDYIFLVYFVFSPIDGVQQAATLLIAWIHGAIGLWFWLRLKPWFLRRQPLILAGLLLLPTLALAGMVAGGREVALLAENAEWLAARLTEIQPPSADEVAVIYAAERWLLIAYGGLLVTVLLLRGLRRWREHRSGLLRLVYPGGLRVSVLRGTSILEASQTFRIPHAAVCGGRGRCSTCRVRVLRGLENLPPPLPAEARVLARVGAGDNVRLACQARPTGPLEVMPLLPSSATPRDAWPRPGYLQGQERDIAVLFADLRGFTGIAEGKLPYDVVFLLNRYFRGMARAVEEAGGHLDKFIGDGVMALFGLQTVPAVACRQALAAARAMALELAEINRALAQDLPRPLKLGIGIHVGPAIIGEMGAGRAVSVTAIGDTVNTASRLEALTKDYEAELVVSEDVMTLAGVPLAEAVRHEVTLRGRSETLQVRSLALAADLPLEEVAVPRPQGPTLTK